MSRAKSTRDFTAGGRRRALTPATFHNAETPARTRTRKTSLKLRPLRIFASEATRSVRGGNYRSRKRLTLCSRRRRPTQKLSLALSWTTRAPLVDVKRPKPLDLMLVLIAEKLVWLKALKRSPRICKRRRSVIARLFDKARSMFQKPGRRRELRPNVPGRADAPLAVMIGTSANARGLR